MSDFFDYHTHDYHKKNAFISIKYEDFLQLKTIPENSKLFLEYHPWNLPAKYSEISEDFIKTAANSKIYGIGEIGLDKLKTKNTSLNVQLAYFERLVNLASVLQKPIMLHIVKAWPEAIEILKKYQVETIYLHGFYGKIEFLRQILDFGMIVSLNPKMLEKMELYQFLRENPNFSEQIKLETDDSDINIIHLYSRFYEGLKNG